MASFPLATVQKTNYPTNNSTERLLEKILAPHMVNKFRSLCTTACHVSLPSARFIKSTPSNSTLQPTPGSSKWYFYFTCPIKLLRFSLLAHTCYTSLPSHLRFDHMNNICWQVQIRQLLITQFSPISCHVLPLRPKTPPSTPCSPTHSAYIAPAVWPAKFHIHTKQGAKLEFCGLMFVSKLQIMLIMITMKITENWNYVANICDFDLKKNKVGASFTKQHSAYGSTPRPLTTKTDLNYIYTLSPYRAVSVKNKTGNVRTRTT
jgi:hypothetical protein